MRTGLDTAALGPLLPGQLRRAASWSTAAGGARTAAQGAAGSDQAAEQAPGAATPAGAPAAPAAAPGEDAWPPLHTPADPGAAGLAARFLQEQASGAAEPADAGSVSCTDTADMTQRPGEAAESGAVCGGAAADSPLAVLQLRLKQAGQNRGETKARPRSCSAAKTRECDLRDPLLIALCV